MTDFVKRADLCKVEIDKYRPFEGNMLQQVKSFYRVSTTWTSNALEGNTLTESETKVILEDGITIGGKTLRETLEASGHAKAYDYMFTLMKKNIITISDIQKLHQLFYDMIERDKAGVFRKEQVFVSGSKYPVCIPEEIESEMEELCVWMNSVRAKMHPIEFAAKLHQKFVYIHPFIDGNGRTARLLMNTALIQAGYLPCVISPYIRLDYINALEAGHKDESVFTRFIAEAEYETEKDFIRMLGAKIPEFKEI